MFDKLMMEMIDRVLGDGGLEQFQQQMAGVVRAAMESQQRLERMELMLAHVIGERNALMHALQNRAPIVYDEMGNILNNDSTTH